MPGKNKSGLGSGSNDPSTTTQDSHAAAFLASTLFLIAPIALLLISGREHPTPIEDYQRAVREAAQPNASQVSHSLISVGFGKPVTVVTWTRQDRVSDYQAKTAPPDQDTWVTVVPELRLFCQDYVKSHGSDPRSLSLRLEERLGLPPNSNHNTFVELTVVPRDITEFFRPCGDPSPTSTTCQPLERLTLAQFEDDLNTGDPKKKQAAESRYWFLNNYYGSFASSRQYPWTSLGYTFDWAPSQGGESFERFGESEFVIPAKTPIQFASATDTIAYCSPH